MDKVLAVLRREYLQSIKTKAFWIGTLALPVMMVVLFGLSIGAQVINPERQKRLAVVDQTGKVTERVAARLADRLLKDGSAEYVIEDVPVEGDVDSTRRALEPEVLEGQLYGIVTVGTDLDEPDNFRLYRKSVGDESTESTINRAVTDAVIGLRLAQSDLDLDQDQLESLVEPVELGTYQITEGEARKKSFMEDWIATFAFVLILFFTLYFHGFTVTRSIIQEKTNRVIEVMLGSLSSDQLMTGKILGIGLVGLTQVGVYTSVGIATRVALGMFSSNDVVVNALAPSKLAFFILFFVLGYFMFASLFAIVGAVCNTEQDAQNLQLPVTMTLMIPYLTTFFFVKHPDSLPTVITSLIPLFTPMVMMMRINVLPPPAWQVALSVVLMLGTIYLLFRAAAKVFRIGTLMYGKRPSIPEIWRWARS